MADFYDSGLHNWLAKCVVQWRNDSGLYNRSATGVVHWRTFKIAIGWLNV